MKWHTSLNCLFTIIFGLMRCINKYAIDDVSGLQTQKVSNTTANETMEKIQSRRLIPTEKGSCDAAFFRVTFIIMRSLSLFTTTQQMFDDVVAHHKTIVRLMGIFLCPPVRSGAGSGVCSGAG